MASGKKPDGVRAAVPAVSMAASAIDAQAVQCASELFLERGIAAVKMTEIAEAAGMGVATLYRHFSTKAAIAVAAAQMMWERLMSSYDELVATDAYQRLDGGSRLEVLLATYKERVLYLPGFPAFVDELDRLILAGALEGDVVREYAYVLSCGYSHFQQAYELGRADGSIAREVDFALFYRSLAHALMSVGSKLSRGEVLPTDDFSSAHAELDCIIDMAIRSLRIKG